MLARPRALFMLSPGIKTTFMVRCIAVLGGLLSVLCAGTSPAAVDDRSLPTEDARIARILHEAAGSRAPGDRIVSISAHFLDVPYLAGSLIGGPEQPERLVLRLDGFDCFTYLDTVEALRRSSVANDFPAQLVQVRYRNGTVAYANRRHFFSDWVSEPDSPIRDVTAQVGRDRVVTVVKQLNAAADGAPWVPGIGVVPRKITYIPASALDDKVLAALDPGDYIGVYSRQPGLDVSHTGLIVKAGASVVLRHASSRGGVQRVTDEELAAYMHGKAGLVVYRATP